MPVDGRSEIAFRLPGELHEQLRNLAAGRSVSVTAIVEEIAHTCADPGAMLDSGETVTLALSPDPDLLRGATEMITAIRVGIERRTNTSS